MHDKIALFSGLHSTMTHEPQQEPTQPLGAQVAAPRGRSHVKRKENYKTWTRRSVSSPTSACDLICFRIVYELCPRCVLCCVEEVRRGVGAGGGRGEAGALGRRREEGGESGTLRALRIRGGFCKLYKKPSRIPDLASVLWRRSPPLFSLTFSFWGVPNVTYNKKCFISSLFLLPLLWVGGLPFSVGGWSICVVSMFPRREGRRSRGHQWRTCFLQACWPVCDKHSGMLQNCCPGKRLFRHRAINISPYYNPPQKRDHQREKGEHPRGKSGEEGGKIASTPCGWYPLLGGGPPSLATH